MHVHYGHAHTFDLCATLKYYLVMTNVVFDVIVQESTGYSQDELRERSIYKGYYREILEKVSRNLLSPRNAVGLWGMAGVGKTSLLLSILNDFQSSGAMRRLFPGGVFYYSFGSFSEESVDDVMNRKTSALLKRKTDSSNWEINFGWVNTPSTLFVLDNVSDPKVVERFRGMIGDGSGHGLLVTSRKSTPLGNMDVNKIFELIPRPDRSIELLQHVSGYKVNPVIAHKLSESVDHYPIAVGRIGFRIAGWSFKGWPNKHKPIDPQQLLKMILEHGPCKVLELDEILETVRSTMRQDAMLMCQNLAQRGLFEFSESDIDNTWKSDTRKITHHLRVCSIISSAPVSGDSVDDFDFRWRFHNKLL